MMSKEKSGNVYYPWVRVEPEVWLLLEVHDEDHQLFEPGWYFSDETDNFNGPYPTRAEASAALALYAERL